MSNETHEKYEKVSLKIEKIVNPFITIKIAMPEGADKEAFLELENDEAFIESVKNQAKEWLMRNREAP